MKPSKETRDVLEREQEIGAVGHEHDLPSFRRAPGADAAGPGAPAATMRVQQPIDARHDAGRCTDAGEAAREGQHDRDEQPAHGEQPELAGRFRRRPVLAQLTSSVPDDRADRRMPSADRAEDHHLDRRHDADEGRRHEADLQREHRAADRGDRRREAEDEDLEVGDVVAGEADAVFLVAHRHQDAAELAVSRRTARASMQPSSRTQQTK